MLKKLDFIKPNKTLDFLNLFYDPNLTLGQFLFNTDFIDSIDPKKIEPYFQFRFSLIKLYFPTQYKKLKVLISNHKTDIDPYVCIGNLLQNNPAIFKESFLNYKKYFTYKFQKNIKLIGKLHITKNNFTKNSSEEIIPIDIKLVDIYHDRVIIINNKTLDIDDCSLPLEFQVKSETNLYFIFYDTL